MRIPPLKLLREKNSGLFFGPSDPANPGTSTHEPRFDRDMAWLYDEQELLTAVRQYYGGDGGMNFVESSEPTEREFFCWCGRKGGRSKSVRKARNCRRNGKKSRGRPRNLLAKAQAANPGEPLP